MERNPSSKALSPAMDPSDCPQLPTAPPRAHFPYSETSAVHRYLVHIPLDGTTRLAPWHPPAPTRQLSPPPTGHAPQPRHHNRRRTPPSSPKTSRLSPTATPPDLLPIQPRLPGPSDGNPHQRAQTLATATPRSKSSSSHGFPPVNPTLPPSQHTQASPTPLQIQSASSDGQRARPAHHMATPLAKSQQPHAVPKFFLFSGTAWLPTDSNCTTPPSPTAIHALEPRKLSTISFGTVLTPNKRGNSSSLTGTRLHPVSKTKDAQ